MLTGWEWGRQNDQMVNIKTSPEAQQILKKDPSPSTQPVVQDLSTESSLYLCQFLFSVKSLCFKQELKTPSSPSIKINREATPAIFVFPMEFLLLFLLSVWSPKNSFNKHLLNTNNNASYCYRVLTYEVNIIELLPS